MTADNDVHSESFVSRLDDWFTQWSMNEGIGWRSAEARRRKWRHDSASAARWRAHLAARQTERAELTAYEE